MARTAHFTTKIEQNKLKYKEVEQLYKNYKKDPLTIKQKAIDKFQLRFMMVMDIFIHDDLSKIKDAFSVEEYFDKRIEDYYDTLMLATQGDLKPFIIFYLECVIISLTKVLNELLRYDKIKHMKELDVIKHYANELTVFFSIRGYCI